MGLLEIFRQPNIGDVNRTDVSDVPYEASTPQEQNLLAIPSISVPTTDTNYEGFLHHLAFSHADENATNPFFNFAVTIFNYKGSIPPEETLENTSILTQDEIQKAINCHFAIRNEDGSIVSEPVKALFDRQAAEIAATKSLGKNTSPGPPLIEVLIKFT